MDVPIWTKFRQPDAEGAARHRKGPVSQRAAMEYGISSTNGVLLFATCRARVSVRVSVGLVGRLGLSSKG